MNELPPRIPFSQSYGETTRFNILENVQSTFRRGSDEMEMDTLGGQMKHRAMRRMIDWDGVLIYVNAWCDRWQTVAELKSLSKRRAAARMLEAEQILMAANPKDRPLFLLGRDGPGRQTTVRVANQLISLQHMSCEFLDDRADARWTVLRTQLALKRWWFRHGKFPQTLSELIPEFLAEMPIDPFSDRDEPLKYVVVPDQIRIYSIGKNQIDEGGLKTELGREDDIVATFPKM